MLTMSWVKYECEWFFENYYRYVHYLENLLDIEYRCFSFDHTFK